MYIVCVYAFLNSRIYIMEILQRSILRPIHVVRYNDFDQQVDDHTVRILMRFCGQKSSEQMDIWNFIKNC